MIKIATPISSLFEDSSVGKEIARRSSCLELREHSPANTEPKQYSFHFDRDIIRHWNEEERDLLRTVIFSKKELKLVSFHMSAACSDPVLIDDVFYEGGREFSRQEMLECARNNVNWLRKNIIRDRNIEIAVENNNFYSTPAYKHIADADFISQIISENRILLVFDIAHAKISAYNRKIPYKEYLTALPLDKIVQIHISKEGFNDKGWAFDTHELPDEVTFEQTKKLTSKFSPEYLTIEYYKSKDKLIEVLKEYQKLCGKLKESMV